MTKWKIFLFFAKLSEIQLCSDFSFFSFSQQFLSVVAQSYKVDVEILAASRGCTAILRCVVPSFVKELVRVVSWVQEPAFFIYPSLQGGEFDIITRGCFHNFLFTIISLNVKNLQMENIICCQAESF